MSKKNRLPAKKGLTAYCFWYIMQAEMPKKKY